MRGKQSVRTLEKNVSPVYASYQDLPTVSEMRESHRYDERNRSIEAGERSYGMAKHASLPKIQNFGRLDNVKHGGSMKELQRLRRQAVMPEIIAKQEASAKKYEKAR